MTAQTPLEHLDRLVGAWTTEATHPMLPGVVVHGDAQIEWLEGARFLIVRATCDHPDFPDSISMIGFTDADRVEGFAEAATPGSQLTQHYYDSRGVFRIYTVTIDETAWRTFRDAPGFSQRFTGTFADGGNTIVGLSQLCRDDVHWNDDLAITYRRQPRP